MKRLDRRLPIVAFLWDDAVGNSGWFAGKDLEDWVEDRQKMQMFDVGILLSRTEREITIAQRINFDVSVDGVGMGSLHQVPRTWVKEMRVLGYVDPRNRKFVAKRTKKP